MISSGERLFVTEGVEQNVRADGRARMDFRLFNVLPNEIEQAHGSSRFKMDGAEILVSVNVQLGAPPPLTPTKGEIVFGVECMPSANPEFEGRGSDSANTLLASQLEQLVAQGIKLEDLCVIPGKYAWTLAIDVLVVESAGSLLDAMSLATKAALKATKLPAVKQVVGDDGEETVQLSQEDAKSLVEDAPICVSLSKLGNSYVVDATAEEELCTSARLSVGVNRAGRICSIQKAGVGGLAASALIEMLKVAKTIGTDLIKKLDASIKV